MSETKAAPHVAVKPKAGTKFYHGHGHHHFEEDRVLHLPAKDAERLVKDGLVELAGDDAAAKDGAAANGEAQTG